MGGSKLFNCPVEELKISELDVSSSSKIKSAHAWRKPVYKDNKSAVGFLFIRWLCSVFKVNDNSKWNENPQDQQLNKKESWEKTTALLA